MSVEPSERPTGAIKALEDPPSFVPSAVRFTDRHDAGRQLAALLEPFREERPVVVGIARGGVPVAAEVARALDAPLDIAVVRKIGAPQNPEYAIGALAEGGVHVLSTGTVRALGLSEAELQALVARVEGELAERLRRYRGARDARRAHRAHGDPRRRWPRDRALGAGRVRSLRKRGACPRDPRRAGRGARVGARAP